jgi:hypothetical protein
MSAALTFVLAAVVTQAQLPAEPQPRGAAVSARATVEILRPATNSETGGTGEVKRHVSRREPGRVTIVFE